VILGIITARGGSKRLPRKNIKDLCGKPLIAWSIETARMSLIDRVVVTTEDAEIAEVAASWDAEVFHRNPDFATDEASIYDAIIEVLDEIPAEWVVLLHPTSPLRNSDDIDSCINACISKAAPACISCEFMVPVPNGAVYCAFVPWLREHRNFDCGRTVVYQMPRHRSVDINTLEDFERAEEIVRAGVR